MRFLNGHSGTAPPVDERATFGSQGLIAAAQTGFNKPSGLRARARRVLWVVGAVMALLGFATGVMLGMVAAGLGPFAAPPSAAPPAAAEGIPEPAVTPVPGAPEQARPAGPAILEIAGCEAYARLADEALEAGEAAAPVVDEARRAGCTLDPTESEKASLDYWELAVPVRKELLPGTPACASYGRWADEILESESPPEEQADALSRLWDDAKAKGCLRGPAQQEAS